MIFMIIIEVNTLIMYMKLTIILGIFMIMIESFYDIKISDLNKSILMHWFIQAIMEVVVGLLLD